MTDILNPELGLPVTPEVTAPIVPPPVTPEVTAPIAPPPLVELTKENPAQVLDSKEMSALFSAPPPGPQLTEIEKENFTTQLNTIEAQINNAIGWQKTTASENGAILIAMLEELRNEITEAKEYFTK